MNITRINNSSPTYFADISSLLGLNSRPLSAIKDFILIFSEGPLAQNPVSFHYMYNAPIDKDPIKQLIVYGIDAQELQLIGTNGEYLLEQSFIVEPNKIMIFGERSFHAFPQPQIAANNTIINLTSYPDEQGYWIRIMTLRKEATDFVPCKFSYYYLVARIYKLDWASSMLAAELQKYHYVVIHEAAEPNENVDKVFYSTSWVFDILLPFRIQINDKISDTNV